MSALLLAGACTLVGSLLSAGPATAQISGTSTVSVDATVVAIDKANRTLTVKTSDGQEESTKVGPKAANSAFEFLEKGLNK